MYIINDYAYKLKNLQNTFNNNPEELIKLFCRKSEKLSN